MTDADPPIISFRISWRVGGSLILGFSSQIEVPYGDCCQYKETYDSEGHRTVTQLPELMYNIIGLTSEVPYEFRVTAVNIMGEGIWSEPSNPILLPNPKRAPKMPELKLLKDLNSVVEWREQLQMDRNDWDSNV